MRVSVTGATGFIGRYVVNRLTSSGLSCRCWFRPESDRGGFEMPERMEWIDGDLAREDSMRALVADCDAVVHSALYRAGTTFRGGEGALVPFLETNLMGTIRLIEAARAAGVRRFIFVSTCAVHERILDDRPLDETHPLWPATHYGAHKAAVEKFVHSYGFGEGYDICALRPSGVYGVAQPVHQSKWADMIRSIKRGEDVTCEGGGKEVHAADVAQAVQVLLDAKGIAGESYSCCDGYVSTWRVAQLAKELSGSDAMILGQPKEPRHQIVTDKLRSLGVTFGGEALLRETVSQLLDSL